MGRTRTAPGLLGSGGPLRIALASCQNWQHGYFTPYADMLAQDPDLVLFVGDYIYESGPSATAVRRHEEAASRTRSRSTATGTPSTAPTPT